MNKYTKNTGSYKFFFFLVLNSSFLKVMPGVVGYISVELHKK